MPCDPKPDAGQKWNLPGSLVPIRQSVLVTASAMAHGSMQMAPGQLFWMLFLSGALFPLSGLPG